MGRIFTGVLLGLVLGVAAPSVRADEKFPPYRVPERHCARFEAERVEVVLSETRTAPGRSFLLSDEAIKKRRARPPADAPPGVPQSYVLEELNERLGRHLAGRGGKLVFDVVLLELAVQKEEPWIQSVSIEIRVHRPGGPVLLTRRAVSRFQGGLGGMQSRTEEELGLAVIDAFERAALREEFVRETNRALVEGPAPARELPAVKNDARIGPHEGSASAHVIGLTFDAWRAYSLGVRYLHDHVHSGSGFGFGGYGAELRAMSSDGNPMHAAGAALAVVRGGLGVEQAYSLEVGVGATHAKRTAGLVVVGMFMTLYYAELGGSIQVPFRGERRPDWLSPVAIAVRVNVPLALTSHELTAHSPEKLEDPLIPGFRQGPR